MKIESKHTTLAHHLPSPRVTNGALISQRTTVTPDHLRPTLDLPQTHLRGVLKSTTGDEDPDLQIGETNQLTNPHTHLLGMIHMHIRVIKYKDFIKK